jgi:hypothetical protein
MRAKEKGVAAPEKQHKDNHFISQYQTVALEKSLYMSFQKRNAFTLPPSSMTKRGRNSYCGGNS